MYSKNATEKDYYDVIVVGGGIAGVAAAVSAARTGAKVLLAEKQVNLGGLATGGLISWYEPICDGKNDVVVKGIAEELIKLSVKYSYDSLPVRWGGTSRSAERRDRYSTRFSPTVFALVLDEYVTSNGVDLLFDTLATYPEMNGNICTGIIVENVSGTEYYRAGAVIDATGSACIMQRAGVKCVEGKNYFSFIAHKTTDEIINKYIEDGITWRLREWESVGSDLEGDGQPEDYKLISGTDARENTDFILKGKLEMLERIKKWDRYGYELMSLPTMPQFRTIRHIVGDSSFAADTDAAFSDSAGRLTDFRSDRVGDTYDFPKSALYNSEFPNLFAAGRIVSVSNSDGWEVARVIPSCAKTGEEAGKLAAIYAKKI